MYPAFKKRVHQVSSICRENFYGTTYFLRWNSKLPLVMDSLWSSLSLILVHLYPGHILITNNITFLRFGKLKITANILYRPMQRKTRNFWYFVSCPVPIKIFFLYIFKRPPLQRPGNRIGRLMSTGWVQYADARLEPVIHPPQLTV